MAKDKDKDSAARKTARYTGAALTAAGVLGAIKGRPFLKMTARRATGKKDPQKDLSDYIAGSQTAMNEGITGKLYGAKLKREAKRYPRQSRVTGGGQVHSKRSLKYENEKIAKAIRKAKAEGKSTKGIAKKIRDDIGMESFQNSHYRRFRSGHKEALKHYDWEASSSIRHRQKTSGMDGRMTQDPKTGKKKFAPQKGKASLNRISTGRKKLLGRNGLIQRHLNEGLNEKEAVAKALTAKDPDIRNYAKALVASKSGGKKKLGLNPLNVLADQNAYRKYQAIAGTASSGILAGGALTGASYLKAKDKKKKKK